MYDLITVLGPTASGKTSFAAALARHLGTEIISGDSRQVYRRMDIGTGKDLEDYRIDGVSIPYHLIDICEPGTKYNVFQFQHDFFKVFRQIRERGKLPVLCGGTGLYIESVLKGYKLLDVPQNPELRESLKDKSLSELEPIIASYKTLHNKTDVDSAQRAIRAIEIEVYYQQHSNNTVPSDEFLPVNSLIIGIEIDREARRKKISERLHFRLANGMIEEVQRLLDEGIPPDDLIYYGLEYKYLTQYLIGELSYSEMIAQLEIAIHQFAKRQMTWFRGMERRGITIHWLPASLPTDAKIARTMELCKT
ncbi:MAG: tRNA (adenosine(37)-N6)-dimethylallyltransferase MiaA [Tannerella sp.]|jgi:tRNA dimethylallyltransferase|nr:tRNA (adenosine(37)-N6)-dimethylallyltransferase MiaA [Tannerella sp.]